MQMLRVKLLILLMMRGCGLFALGRMLTRRTIMVVGWHGVSQDAEHRYFPSLYISRSEFRRRLEFLTRCYEVISLDNAVKQLESGRVRRRQVVLTFDDGNYDYHSEAAPILIEFGCPATNYIVTHFAATREPVWMMLVRYIVALGSDKFDKKADATDSNIDSKGIREKREHSERLWLNQLSNLGTPEAKWSLVEDMATRYGIDLQPILNERLMHTMSADEIKHLSKQGFDFQMHTHEHLNAVDHFDVLEDQVRECRRLLEDWTDRKIEHFCYPSGRWNNETAAVLAMQGVKSAVTTRPGPNLAGTNRLNLRRVLNGQINSQLEFEFEMSNLKWLIRSFGSRHHRLNPAPQIHSYAEEKAARRLQA